MASGPTSPANVSRSSCHRSVSDRPRCAVRSARRPGESSRVAPVVVETRQPRTTSARSTASTAAAAFPSSARSAFKPLGTRARVAPRGVSAGARSKTLEETRRRVGTRECRARRPLHAPATSILTLTLNRGAARRRAMAAASPAGPPPTMATSSIGGWRRPAPPPHWGGRPRKSCRAGAAREGVGPRTHAPSLTHPTTRRPLPTAPGSAPAPTAPAARPPSPRPAPS